MSDTENAEIRLRGISASPGICIGKAYLVDKEGVDVIEKFAVEEDRLEEEVNRFKTAVSRAEADMARMTRDLIDGIVSIGGAYYLPYRPHATVDQFVRSYARAGEFAAAKRVLDPGLLFRNNLWDTYLEPL